MLYPTSLAVKSSPCLPALEASSECSRSSQVFERAGKYSSNSQWTLSILNMPQALKPRHQGSRTQRRAQETNQRQVLTNLIKASVRCNGWGGGGVGGGDPQQRAGKLCSTSHIPSPPSTLPAQAPRRCSKVGQLRHQPKTPGIKPP